MTNRWAALALLFSARTVMAFQFQTVAALSPYIEAEYSVGLGSIGFLFGLYMAPGLLVAIPGGGFARRFGEKRVVILSLWLMAIGLAVMSLLPGWNAAIAGRLIAGVGGILMNVIMTKMVADWFEGKEIATAMSIFIVSFPAGIAAALFVLPSVAEVAGFSVAMSVGAGLAAFAALAFLAYRPAPSATQAVRGGPLPRDAFAVAVMSGATWGFLNAALAVVFGFGVVLLVARSVEVGLAGQITSLTMITLALAAPFGGFIADRTGRYMILIALSVLIMAACLVLISAGLSGFWLFILFGLACAMCSGPVMSLPGRYLAPEERSRGMGIFFTVYYVSMLAGPLVAGFAAESAGRAEAAFVVGVVFCALTLAGLLGTHRARIARAA